MKYLGLLQEHTVKIYSLNEEQGAIEQVSARSLLRADRFDLFAKLFYIDNRINNPELARKIYQEHIIAFNPDGKEPGRDDKHGVNDFIASFDRLINDLSTRGFDDSKSLVPVGTEGFILDGSHRVAVLAYYNEPVTILRFNGVNPIIRFDYEYFKKRGLSWSVCDCIAEEMVRWLNNIRVACIWPRVSQEKDRQTIIDSLSARHTIGYRKDLRVSLTSLSKFIARCYAHQSWVGDSQNNFAGAADKALQCFGKGGKISFVFFEMEDSDNLVATKDGIRSMFPYEKHSIHITDNQEETLRVAKDVLLDDGLSKWYGESSITFLGTILYRFRELVYRFKYITLIRIKVCVWKIIHCGYLKNKKARMEK